MTPRFEGIVGMAAIECASCKMLFGVPARFKSDRLDDHETFYCPAGHKNYYSGASEKDRLLSQLEATQRRLASEQSARLQATSERDAAKRRYGRIRDRVKNGVCPCCNRTFQNLARHMATKHPNFGSEATLRALRLTYGLTQADLAAEIGVSAAVISNYENGRRPQPVADPLIEAWIEAQA